MLFVYVSVAEKVGVIKKVPDAFEFSIEFICAFALIPKYVAVIKKKKIFLILKVNKLLFNKFIFLFNYKN